MSRVYCSKCGRPFDSEKSKTMPFCSERCQQLDLAGWLDEKYGLPYEGEDRKTAEFDHESQVEKNSETSDHDFR